MEEEIIMSTLQYGIAWSNEFNLGNEQVDMQHRRLFELLNNLVISCMDGEDTAKLQETLDFLVNYTVRHFEDEEALQRQYGYPEYESHKQLHEAFKSTVGGLVQKFQENGSSAELSRDVNTIVVKWLIHHIQREDKKISEHIKKVGGAT